MPARQSQQAWIIFPQAGSPLAQVRDTPSLVGSQQHVPLVRGEYPPVMPFIMTQQRHPPPASMVHRLWTIPAAALSAHVQVIFMPSVNSWTLRVHRGTISQLGLTGGTAGMVRG